MQTCFIALLISEMELLFDKSHAITNINQKL